MLVLSRKQNQSIMLGEKIEITVLEIKGDQVRIGINAPSNVTILRKEVYLQVKEENKAALQGPQIKLENLAETIRKTRNDEKNK